MIIPYILYIIIYDNQNKYYYDNTYTLIVIIAMIITMIDIRAFFIFWVIRHITRPSSAMAHPPPPDLSEADGLLALHRSTCPDT